ncbi:MAG TPA: glutamine amidotransferase [Terracidiphilus sp.]|nr:glutamine amidotransferase [Terracidiphilus sp.]
MSKSALVVRHVAFEDLGHFAPVLASSGYGVSYCDVGLDAFDPATFAAADLLIVLGGPIGVYEEDKYPFLTQEVELIRARLAAKSPTLGICLGAQLMARALGARVYPGPAKEIGFSPLTLTSAGRVSCLSVFEGKPVLHWHGDTFGLPAGATLLASTQICTQQAFSLGRNAIGFQFHPEAGAAGFERWLIGHTSELAAAGKSIPALRADYERLASQLAKPAEECLLKWLSQLEV